MRPLQKTCLGDGVYAQIAYGDLVLTTENGARTTNCIVLEPEVWAALLAYLNRVRRDAGPQPQPTEPAA